MLFMPAQTGMLFVPSLFLLTQTHNSLMYTPHRMSLLRILAQSPPWRGERVSSGTSEEADVFHNHMLGGSDPKGRMTVQTLVITHLGQNGVWRHETTIKEILTIMIIF